MKKIPLTRGKFALVDDSDFEWLSEWKWNLTGDGRNAERRTGGHIGHIILMHRQIMGAKKGQLIDHINQDPLDNRRANLRFADKSINALNAKRRSDNTSGYRGVIFNKQAGKWQANIQIAGRKIHLGFFVHAEKAAEAYEAARKEVLV